MKIRVSQATLRQLDWMVARCEGDEPCKSGGTGLAYCADWLAAGPIIEREIHSIADTTMRGDMNFAWVAKTHVGEGLCVSMYGPTPLVAAMRCLVSSKLGDVVDVPDELIEDFHAEEAPSPPRPAP